MQIRRTSFSDAVGAMLAIMVVAAVAIGLSSSAPAARAASVGQLKQRITAGQGRVSSLSGTVRAASGRVGQLDANISALASRLSRIQADIDAKNRQLDKLRVELAAAQTRLGQLETFEAHAERVLGQQLVASYETDPPNIVSVVIEATGFQDLLNRLAFMQRVRKQDVNVVGHVRAARRAVAAQATHLGQLGVRLQTLTREVVGQRNQLAQASVSLQRQRAAVAQFRNAKAGELAGARAEVGGLQHQLSQLQAAQAALARRQSAPSALSSAPSSSGSAPAPSAGSGPVSAGGFTFPLPKSAAAPPSEWSPDQGVDISAPGNTPEYAVCSGTIVLHGIGGFGPWAPVIHCDGSLDGYSYVYYGHAGPLYQLPIGTHVGAGQVMSSIGPGIVGLSSGPHLEIGFADASGSPIGDQTAGTMLSLLRAAYG
ncbi:MAG: murein hydrolase activator EnvC family protein [Solirubrobacteraceae bacterium]